MEKYRLPASHSLFEEQSLADLLLERYEDLYDEKRTLEKMLRSGGRGYAAMKERLDVLCAALGEQTTTGDSLVDRWEAQIARGEIPDLDEEL